MPADEPVRVALLGCGTVGSAVLRLLDEHADDLAARVGAPLTVVGVGVRRAVERGDVPIEPARFTTDLDGLARRGDVDVVVELIGGLEPAHSLLLAALSGGRSVVTANKELLAVHGAGLHEAAQAGGADLFFEAAVAGAVPLLRPLRESLAGDRVSRVLGIVNGTTNYVLSRMDETGASLDEALAAATELGYAEAEPTADVDGYDAAAKIAILASIAFHSRVPVEAVFRDGIRDITAADIASAREMGYVVKLLAVAERTRDAAGTESIGVRVHPAMIPRTHPLAAVRGAYNAVVVEAEAAGRLMFYGQGAGGTPTASAVLGDVVAAARNRRAGTVGAGESAYAELPVRPVGETLTRYHVSLAIADRAGMLAAVAGAVAGHGVSIRSVRQDGSGDEASLVLVTHRATEAALAGTVEDLRRLAGVRAVTGVVRVEGEPDLGPAGATRGRDES